MYVKCNCMWSYCLVLIRFFKERRGEDLLWYCNITPKPQTHHFHSISTPFFICYVVKSHLSNKTLQKLAQINIYSTKLLIHKPGKCSCFTQVYHRVNYKGLSSFAWIYIDEYMNYLLFTEQRVEYMIAFKLDKLLLVYHVKWLIFHLYTPPSTSHYSSSRLLPMSQEKRVWKGWLTESPLLIAFCCVL